MRIVQVGILMKNTGKGRYKRFDLNNGFMLLFNSSKI